MATNNFKPFAIGSNANVMSQSDYEALAALASGFQAGKASSAQVNKALRQGTVMASALAQFIADNSGNDVLDDGGISEIANNLKLALTGYGGENFLQIGRNLEEISNGGSDSQSSAQKNIGIADSSGYVGKFFSIKRLSGSGTYTPSSDVKKVFVQVVGGGGGGQGAGSVRIVGGGGGGGAYVDFLIESLESSYSYSTGSGGQGSLSTSPGQKSNDGGATSFSDFIYCPGGNGGNSDQTTSDNTGASCIAPGGIGNSPTVNQKNGVTYVTIQNGSPGSYGSAVHPNYLGGNGATSKLGSGGCGTAIVGSPDYANAGGYGAGGGGNASLTNSAFGGNGSDGVIFVWEFK